MKLLDEELNKGSNEVNNSSQGNSSSSLGN